MRPFKDETKYNLYISSYNISLKMLRGDNVERSIVHILGWNIQVYSLKNETRAADSLETMFMNFLIKITHITRNVNTNLLFLSSYCAVVFTPEFLTAYLQLSILSSELGVSIRRWTNKTAVREKIKTTYGFYILCSIQSLKLTLG